MGNAQAMNRLGVNLMYGCGVEKNRRDASEWFRKAAALGNLEAMHRLGENLSYGLGVAENNTKPTSGTRRRPDWPCGCD